MVQKLKLAPSLMSLSKGDSMCHMVKFFKLEMIEVDGEKSSTKTTNTAQPGGLLYRRQRNSSFETSWKEHESCPDSLSSTDLRENNRAEGLRSSSYKAYINSSRSRCARSQNAKPSDRGNWRETPTKSLDKFHDDNNWPDHSDEDLLRVMLPNRNSIRICRGSSSHNANIELLKTNPVTKSKFDFDRPQNQTVKRLTPNQTLSKTLIMLKGKDPKSALFELTKSEITLKQYIEKAHVDHNFLKMFLNVLANAFVCDTAPTAHLMLFETLRENKFFDALALFLFDMQDHIEDKKDALKHEDVLKNVLHIAVEQISRNPSSVAVFVRVQKVIGQIINSFQEIDDYVLDEGIQTNFALLTQRKKEADKILKCSGSSDNVRPPEDFREIQVKPGLNEIKGGFKPFLRANKVEGKYNDLDHYLDVQFRLLREDLVGPLREGISEYVKTISTNQNRKDKKKMKGDLKFYNATVHSPVVTEHGYCLKMELKITRVLRKINWSVSKRLIFGSLLCLTDDDFETFTLATVVGRDDEDIKKGLFTIQLDGNIRTFDLLHKVFKIAETSAYFESYKYILTGLQSMKTGDLPFEKYIVHCTNIVDKPAYLTSETTFDLQPLAEQDMEIFAQRKFPDVDVTRRQLHDDNEFYEQLPSRNHAVWSSSGAVKCVNILDTKSWPEKEVFHLDECQYDAVKTALSKEFSVIQGPPGTGKTYTGLQIARALLHNLNKWQMTELQNGQQINSPMLIVCYTNHALDQFLEGVHSFFKGDILRVGGRSKSDVLVRCNLKKFRHSNLIEREIKNRRSQTESELNKLSNQVSFCSKQLDLFQYEIVHEDFLFPVMDRRFYNCLKHEQQRSSIHSQSTAMITTWLGLTNIIAEVRRKIKYNQRSSLAEQKFVSVDDDFTERRSFGIRQNLKAQTKLIANIRRESIAYFVEDIVIPEKTNREEKRRLQAERELRAYLKTTIHEKITSFDVMTQEEANRINNIWHLSQNDRWRLYRLWISQICKITYNEIDSKRVLYESASIEYNESHMQIDKEIMKNATVIGMTTTCAAKYQSVLTEIGPKIIIVEEAAEVLEAHIVTTLSKSCQHLILIGDHKQLRPNPNVYKLAVRYNLNISLFERMIGNGIKFNSLQLQHRMRPEIAGIMRHIYPNLEDNANVKNYPNVKGVSTNLFFIHHEQMEENNDEMKSYSNIHEALFVVGLCRYLLLQEYKKEQITVLTTYTGQLLCIRNLMPYEEFEGVRVTVVDNYQGEENDIVILSLVRSNLESRIGFMKSDNRICVALSRAKIGFYVIGNFKQLAENSSLWKSITDEIKAEGKLGEGLALYCQNHPTDEAIVATEGKDFRRAPNGGCSKKCVVRLQCGHVCQQFCHVLDTEHMFYRCRKPCQRVICEEHDCPDDCYKKCRPCQILVTKTIPKCGHKQTVKCYLDPNRFVCQMPCQFDLPCGHQCKEVCGAQHTEECLAIVERALPCGHTVSLKCFQKMVDIECPSPCEALLKCEHLCGGTCSQCFRGRVHTECKHECKRILVCGHECSAFCNNCPPCKAKCENRCLHSLCQNKCGDLCVQCQEPCEWQCEHFKCSKLCSEPCDRQRCNEPCDKFLPCGHLCMGLCGEPCAEFFCRVCNVKEVTEILFGDEDDEAARFVYLEDCGHNIESKAMDTYMDMKDNMQNVQLKGCPRCKTPIRRCLRYGSVIKESLQQIERVKLAVKNKSDVDSLKDNLSKDIQSNRVYESIERNISVYINSSTLMNRKSYKKWTCIHLMLKRIERYKQTICTENQIVTLKNQRTVFEALVDVVSKLKGQFIKMTGSLQRSPTLSFFSKLEKHILKERDVLSEQEIDDYKNEIQRGNDYVRFLKMMESIKVAGKSEDASKKLAEIEDLLTEPVRYGDDKKSLVKQELDNLKEVTKIDGIEISEDERLEIVKAMGLSKGHWFKCPNNHIYAIGECGGAMERRKCPECTEDIGGDHHRLTSGNKLAPEMDGASYAAYSEEANNMANFDLNDLQ